MLKVSVLQRLYEINKGELGRLSTETVEKRFDHLENFSALSLTSLAKRIGIFT